MQDHRKRDLTDVDALGKIATRGRKIFPGASRSGIPAVLTMMCVNEPFRRCELVNVHRDLTDINTLYV